MKTKEQQKRIKNGFKYVFEAPIGNLKKCIKCKKYQPQENYSKDKLNKSGRKGACKKCENVAKTRRRKENLKESRKYANTRARIRRYLHGNGDGCCLYCGETNPFMLNNHHMFGRENNDFTITLCEIHHAPFTRGIPFVLQDWY